MAIDIRSQEFANAWRTVSEALLAYIQNGELGTSVVSQSKSEEINHIVINESKADTNSEEGKTIQDVRYAACPVKQVDGSYTFKNLKEERQQESTYKITRYVGGYCEFELCDLQGEARQIFKDNQSDRMPSSVGTSTGEITADNKILNVKLGKGVMDGRSVKITEPLAVEFK